MDNKVQKNNDQLAAKMTAVPGCEPQNIGDFLREMAPKTEVLVSNALSDEQENKESGDKRDSETYTPRPSFSEWETVKCVPPPKPALRRSVSAADRLSYLPGCTPKDLMEFEKLKKEVEATPLFDPNEVLRLQNMEKRRKISNVSMVNMPTQPAERPAAAKMLYLPGCSPQEIQKYHRRTSSPMRWSKQNSVTSSTTGDNENEKEPLSERSSTTPWEDFAYYDGNESKPIILNFPRPNIVEPEEQEKKCRNVYMTRQIETEELIPPAKPISIREWSMREQSRTWFHRAFSCFFACLKPCFK